MSSIAQQTPSINPQAERPGARPKVIVWKLDRGLNRNKKCILRASLVYMYSDLLFILPILDVHTGLQAISDDNLIGRTWHTTVVPCEQTLRGCW
jgi:hypothetical protein